MAHDDYDEMQLFSAGIDIVELEFINKLMVNYDYDTLRYLYSSYELTDARSVLRLAVVFAAKEAVSKALGTGMAGLKWTDINVTIDDCNINISLDNNAAKCADKLAINTITGFWFKLNEDVISVIVYAYGQGNN